MNLTVQIDPAKVAVYVRWSTDDQSEGTTLEVQREACELYVRSQGWQFREDLLFIDDGCSGGTLERPGLSALRQAVSRGAVTCVVVYKLDRLSRSVLDTVSLILREWEGLCHVKSTREPIDTTSPTGKMFFYMLASYAEWERSVIKERTLAGKAKRAQHGKNPGMIPPYGYRLGPNKGELVIHEAEAAIVRRIFREYIRGHGGRSIAEGLHRDGIRDQKGAFFQPERLDWLLQNPIYMGVLAYGKTTRLPPSLAQRQGKVLVRFPEPRYARVEGAVPAIINAEEFARAQAVRTSRSHTRGRKGICQPFLLSGVARCPCGAPLFGESQQHDRWRYYRCRNAQLGRPNRCEATLIPAPLLEETVVAQVRQAFAPAQRAHYLAEAARALEEQRRHADEAIAAVTTALGGIERRRRRLDADYDAGELTGKVYTRRLEQLEAEQQLLQAALAAQREALDRLQASGLETNRCDELSARLDGWDGLDAEERKHLLRLAIAGCTAYRAPAAPPQRCSTAPVEITLEVWRPMVAAGLMESEAQTAAGDQVGVLGAAVALRLHPMPGGYPSAG